MLAVGGLSFEAAVYLSCWNVTAVMFLSFLGPPFFVCVFIFFSFNKTLPCFPDALRYAELLMFPRRCQSIQRNKKQADNVC